jgi:hypothetical protein
MDKIKFILPSRPYTPLEALLHVILAFLASFFVLTIGEKESIFELVSIPGFFRFWVKNFIICFLLILEIRFIVYLQSNKTVLQQTIILLTGFIAILFTAYGYSTLYFWSENVNMGRIAYFNTLFPLTLNFLIVTYILQLGWVYALYPIAVQFNIIRSPSFQPHAEIEGYFERKIYSLHPYAILLYHRQTSYLLGTSEDGKVYRFYYSLSAIGKILAQNPDYFKINEGMIIHRSIIREITDAPSRTLDLKIEIQNRTERLRVSQSNKKTFLIWYKAGDTFHQ